VTVLLVLLGGFIGAPARYLTDQYVQSRHDTVLPWGTFTVNAVGSLVLGLVGGAASGGALPEWLLTFVGTGFCGALTTFSTFGWETLRLVETGSWGAATLNVGGSVVVGLGAVALGWVVGTAL
jgi:CrcB protein